MCGPVVSKAPGRQRRVVVSSRCFSPGSMTQVRCLASFVRGTAPTPGILFAFELRLDGGQLTGSIKLISTGTYCSEVLQIPDHGVRVVILWHFCWVRGLSRGICPDLRPDSRLGTILVLQALLVGVSREIHRGLALLNL